MNIEHILTKAQAALYKFTNKEKADLIRIKTGHLTYLATKDLFSLYEAAKTVEQAGITGQFIETGCALGGSAIAIGKAKTAQRLFRIYDAFGMIPRHLTKMMAMCMPVIGKLRVANRQA